MRKRVKEREREREKTGSWLQQMDVGISSVLALLPKPTIKFMCIICFIAFGLWNKHANRCWNHDARNLLCGPISFHFVALRCVVCVCVVLVFVLYFLLDKFFEMVTFVIIVHIKESCNDWNEWTSSLYKNANAYKTKAEKKEIRTLANTSAFYDFMK